MFQEVLDAAAEKENDLKKFISTIVKKVASVHELSNGDKIWSTKRENLQSSLTKKNKEVSKSIKEAVGLQNSSKCFWLNFMLVE